MFYRFIVAAVLVSSFAAAGWAQSPPTQTAPAPSAAAKPAAKKQVPKANAGAKAPVSAETGPCQIGVISAIGDQFTVQHVGLTVLGNEHMEAPIDAWGLDDLLVARVRVAAPGTAVRKVAYARGHSGPMITPKRSCFATTATT